MKKLLSLGLILIPALLFAGPDPQGKQDMVGYGYSDSVGIDAQRYRGGMLSPDALSSGDTLFYINAYGYNGSAMTSTPRATLEINASENWSTTANGTYFSVQVTTNASTTMNEVVRMGNLAGQAYLMITPNLSITVSTPTAVGQMGVTSAGVLYIATSAVSVNSWVKVGAQ